MAKRQEYTDFSIPPPPNSSLSFNLLRAKGHNRRKPAAVLLNEVQIRHRDPQTRRHLLRARGIPEIDQRESIRATTRHLQKGPRGQTAKTQQGTNPSRKKDNPYRRGTKSSDPRKRPN